MYEFFYLDISITPVGPANPSDYARCPSERLARGVQRVHGPANSRELQLNFRSRTRGLSQDSRCGKTLCIQYSLVRRTLRLGYLGICS